MRSALLRLGVFFLASAAPAGAALVDAAALAPALGLARDVPAFRASLLSRVSLVAALSGQPAPTLEPLLSDAASAPTPADPWRAESARLVGTLSARPAVVARHETELRAALGEQGLDLLRKAAGRLQEKAASTPALASQLEALRSGLDPEDPASASSLASRLDALFEGARSRTGLSPAASVAAADRPGGPPLVSLSKPGAAPLLSAAELAAYVERNAVVSPRGLKRVNFSSGDYRPRYDDDLRRLGVDQVVIKTPSRAELAQFSEKDGYHLKSEYERWVTETRTPEEHAAALGKAGLRVRQHEKQLAASADVPIEVAPLTVEAFERWYPVYEDEVVGKPGGKRNVARDFAAKLREKGQLGDGWYGLFYRDPKDATKVVGGAIMKAWPQRGMFVIGYAAYRPELRNVTPSLRTVAEAMKLARSLGFKVLSYGQDTNFYGYDYSLGLMSNKAGSLFVPYPEDEIVLMKTLDDSKIASVTDKAGRTGGYLFFGLKRDGPVVARYLLSRDAGAPKEAQELLGSDRYFDGAVAAAGETTVVWRYRGDDPNPARPPVGIDVVDRKMAAPAPGD